MAGSNPKELLHSDSGGFARSAYGYWEDAKPGLASGSGSARPHPVTSVRGTMAGSAVTDWTAHDSPVFRRIYSRLSPGYGRVMPDSTHDAGNRRLIAGSGRIPAFNTGSSTVPNGFNAHVETIHDSAERRCQPPYVPNGFNAHVETIRRRNKSP